jgi:hypothetical protein
VDSFLLDFPPISYMHSSSPQFVLHALFAYLIAFFITYIDLFMYLLSSILSYFLTSYFFCFLLICLSLYLLTTYFLAYLTEKCWYASLRRHWTVNKPDKGRLWRLVFYTLPSLTRLTCVFNIESRPCMRTNRSCIKLSVCVSADVTCGIVSEISHWITLYH